MSHGSKVQRRKNRQRKRQLRDLQGDIKFVFRSLEDLEAISAGIASDLQRPVGDRLGGTCDCYYPQPCDEVEHTEGALVRHPEGPHCMNCYGSTA